MAKLGKHNFTMTMLFKGIVFLLVIVFSQSTLACDGHAPSDIIEMDQSELVIHSPLVDAHDNHEDCDSQCCEGGCVCELTPCSTLWPMSSGDEHISAVFQQVHSNFRADFVSLIMALLIRPPILS
jgi:hypothetical protein